MATPWRPFPIPTRSAECSPRPLGTDPKGRGDAARSCHGDGQVRRITFAAPGARVTLREPGDECSGATQLQRHAGSGVSPRLARGAVLDGTLSRCHAAHCDHHVERMTTGVANDAERTIRQHRPRWCHHRKARFVSRYCRHMSNPSVPGGVVHELPRDLRVALLANSVALSAWNDITPLARNEFICWVENAKQMVTRQRRIRRTQEELEEGQRRPCCWPGCSHRERTGR